MKQIDAGMTSEVWAVDKNGKTFRLGSNKEWKNMNFQLNHVSAGGSGKSISLSHEAKSAIFGWRLSK